MGKKHASQYANFGSLRKGSTGRAYTIINQYITTKVNLKFHFTSKDVTLLKLKAYIFSFLQLPYKEP